MKIMMKVMKKIMVEDEERLKQLDAGISP